MILHACPTVFSRKRQFNLTQTLLGNRKNALKKSHMASTRKSRT